MMLYNHKEQTEPIIIDFANNTIKGMYLNNILKSISDLTLFVLYVRQFFTRWDTYTSSIKGIRICTYIKR